MLQVDVNMSENIYSLEAWKKLMILFKILEIQTRIHIK